MQDRANLGLPARDVFEDELRRRDQPVHWALVHISGLLTVNLRTGWDAGNRYVEQVAAAIVDAAGTGGTVAHIGGCEFAVATGTGDRASTQAFAQRVRSELTARISVDGVPIDQLATVTVFDCWPDAADPWWVAHTTHRANADAGLRSRLRASFAGEQDLAGLAAAVAHAAVALGAVACEVNFRRATASSGTPPPGTRPWEMEIEGAGSITYWIEPESERAVPVPLLQVIADEVSHAAHRVINQADADTDPLTGLLNRRGLRHRVGHLDGRYTVAFLELDDMKQINDRWGHATGDRALKHLAWLLAAGRDGEITSRWGGDEFVLVLPGTRVDEAAGRLRRLLRQVQRDEFLSGLHLSFSAGVTRGSADLTADIDRADQAMYQAKAAGKARVRIDRG